jgi:predicted porin
MARRFRPRPHIAAAWSGASLAAATLAMSVIGGTLPGPWLSAARADGLPGGNCCADLEERVAELEATTVRKGNRRVSLTLSGQVSRQVMYWDDSAQSDFYSVDNGLNTSRFRFTGSAKINPEWSAGFIYEMDMRIGARSNQVSQIDDDGFSGSGGILGGAAFGDGIGAAGDGVLGIRQAAWYLENTHYGKLQVGRLNTATSGISTIDLSTAGVVITSEPGEFQGGFIMRNGLNKLSFNPAAAGVVPGVGATWATQCGGPSPGLSATSFGAGGAYSNDCWEHGPSRKDAIRYDTPTFWGFTASAAFGEDDFYDAALRYAGEWYGFRVAAGVGHRWYEDREPDVPVPLSAPYDRLSDSDRRQWLTSASIMHLATGLFVSGAFTQYRFLGGNAFERFAVASGINDNRPDIPLWWVDGGIQKNWTGWGYTTVYGEWGRLDNGTAGLLANTAYPLLGPGTGGAFPATAFVTDSHVTWWGAGAVQTIDAAAMDLYIAYRHYDAEAIINDGPVNQIPGGLQGIWFIQAGARIQF